MFAAFGHGVQELVILFAIGFLTFIVPAVTLIVAVLLMRRRGWRTEVESFGHEIDRPGERSVESAACVPTILMTVWQAWVTTST